MSNKMNYFSIGNTVDGTTFCSGVETLAENLIEDNEQDSVITFPSKDGWASLRSTGYRMTTDNTEAVLPLPIYKMNKIWIKPSGLKIKASVHITSPGGDYIEELSIPYTSYKNSAGEHFEYFDITDRVLTAAEWEALPLASSRDEYLSELRKDNTFFWESGSLKIAFLATRYKISGDFFESFLGFDDEIPVWERFIRAVFYQYKDSYYYEYTSPSETFQSYLNPKKETFLDGDTDVRNWQFRIEYVPISSSTKIRARKSAKTKVDYMQPFNQRAEINSASAFGKSMWLAAQKTGVREIKVVKNYTRLADIPPLGALVRHNGKKYRLIANHYLQTNTVFMQVTHTLSENWSSKSKFVSVDQKYRNWKIPQETLWRTVYWEDFLIVSKEPQEVKSPASITIDRIKNAFDHGLENDREIDTLFLRSLKMDNTTATGWVAAPCSTYALGNSLVFSATMKDNLSAGLKRNGDLCEEAFYCFEDGTADLFEVILSSGIGNGTYSGEAYKSLLNTDGVPEIIGDSARDTYPSAMETLNDDSGTYYVNAPICPMFREKYVVYKDAGEAIKFTYQIHFIDDDPDIVIGSKLLERHPLIVKKWSENRRFYTFVSSNYLRAGEDGVVMDFYDLNDVSAIPEGFNVSVSEGNNAMTISLTSAFKEKMKDIAYKSWGIADGNGNLLIGCNDNTIDTLYFSITHKR